MNVPSYYITAATVVDHGVLRVVFADRLSSEVEIISRMRGPVFERARTAEGFSEAFVDAESAPSLGREVPTSRRTRCTSASAQALGQSMSWQPELAMRLTNSGPSPQTAREALARRGGASGAA